MAGHSYEEGKKQAYFGFMLLGFITIIEVAIALVGKGHIIEGVYFPTWVMYVAMIGLSLYKAYFIIGEFMHMKHETRGLAMTVLLPTLLLIWAVIAFLHEGNSWGERRNLIKDKDKREVKTDGSTSYNITAPKEDAEIRGIN